MKYLLTILIILLTIKTNAQFGPALAPTEAINTLSSGPMPSGQNYALQRTQNLPQYSDEDEEYYEETSYTPVEVFVYVPEPITKVLPAIIGQRIFDAVDKRLLEDQRLTKIAEEEAKNFKLNNSDIYTKILPDNIDEFMGGTTFFYLKQNIQMLRALQNMDILVFFGENYMNAETIRLKTLEKNSRITNWNIKFINPYRKIKDDINSDFYKLYIPLPPEIPTIQRPNLQWWRPPNSNQTVWELTVDNILDINKIYNPEERKKAQEVLNKAAVDPQFKSQTISLYGPPSNIIKLLEPNMQNTNRQTASEIYSEDDEES